MRRKSRKLDSLIEIAANLEADTSTGRSNASAESHCKDALIQALRTATKNTKLEWQAEDIIKFCEKHFYRDLVDYDPQ